jgi:hypothetical protein
MEVSPLPEQPERPPLVFISYSHDSKEHKAWVAALANSLRDNGVEVLLDQFDIEPGDNIPQFMNDSVRNADRVLMICTEIYVRRANDGEGGAGYEALIVTGELIRDLGQNKFIPIIRQTGKITEVPTCLSGRSYINLNDGPEYEAQFQELLKALHKVARVAKSPLGPNPFSANRFIGEAAQARKEDRRIEFADTLLTPERAFQFALDTARAGDKVVWRRLLKAAREQGLSKMQEIGIEIDRGMLSASTTEEQVRQLAVRCFATHESFAACLLGAITSENPTFANQLSWIDSILYQPEWPQNGFKFWVNMPELLFFSLQALAGGNLMQTDNIEAALKLATTPVKTNRDSRTARLLEQPALNGWPDSLNHDCSISFRFLDSLFDTSLWLSEPFGSGSGTRIAVNAYYFFLSFLNFVSLIRSGGHPSAMLTMSVPLNFTFGSNQVQEAGYQMLLSHRDFLTDLLKKNNLSKTDLDAHWPGWIQQTNSIGNPWREFLRRANANLPTDLFRDAADL